MRLRLFRRGPAPGAAYEGPVFFGSDGWHYAADDENRRHPLRWTPEGYVYAAPDDPTHFHVHHTRHVDLEQVI